MKEERLSISSLDKIKIKSLQKELENRIWSSGGYKYYSGSVNIDVELDEDLTQDFLDEYEAGNTILAFKVTVTREDEDGGSKDWWTLKVEVDDKCNFVNAEKY